VLACILASVNPYGCPFVRPSPLVVRNILLEPQEVPTRNFVGRQISLSRKSLPSRSVVQKNVTLPCLIFELLPFIHFQLDYLKNMESYCSRPGVRVCVG
jgi:hypothetical protein